MIVLDTSSLIRFFTGDNKKKALRVKEVLEKNIEIYIPDVVFPELEYVLSGKVYGATRKDIIKAFEFLSSKKNITLSKEISIAIEIYKQTSLDIADCLIVAYGKTKGDIFTFDKQLKKTFSSTI